MAIGATTGASHPRPPVGGVQAVGGSAYQFFRSLIQGTVDFFQTTATSTRAARAVDLTLLPALPLALAISAILYNQGEEDQKPNGDPHRWYKDTLMAILGAVLVEHTYLFPLVGLAKTAYKAGSTSNSQDQRHELVKGLTITGLGLIGVHMLKGARLMALDNQEADLLNRLRDPDIEPWLTELKKNYYAPSGQRHLADVLAELRETIAAKQRMLAGMPLPHIHPSPPPPGGAPHVPVASLANNLEELRADIEQLKSEAARLWQEAEQKIETGMGSYYSPKTIVPREIKVVNGLKHFRMKGGVYKGLYTAVQDTQNFFVRAARYLYPMSGYILGGVVAGTLLAKWINRRLDRRADRKAEKQRAEQAAAMAAATAASNAVSDNETSGNSKTKGFVTLGPNLNPDAPNARTWAGLPLLPQRVPPSMPHPGQNYPDPGHVAKLYEPFTGPPGVYPEKETYRHQHGGLNGL